jgi:hypothetical protein
MADFYISDYIVGTIVFMFIIVGSVAMLGLMKQGNPDFSDPRFDSFNKTFNSYDELDAQVEKIQSDVEGGDTSWGVTDVLNAIVFNAWNTLKNIYNSFGFMTQAILGLNTFFGMPVWIPAMILMAITVLITFSIYSATFYRRL